MPSFLSLSAINWGVDLVRAIRDNDVVGIICLLLLLILSLRTGYFIFAKYWEIRSASEQSEEFIAECMEERRTLAEIYKASQSYPDSPLAALLREAYIEYEMEMDGEVVKTLPIDQRVQLGKFSVESALERTMAAEVRKLDSKLVNLATASTLAPFIGLFGTVWGVLGAFQAIGTTGSASIAALAPGISTALVTTIAGLIVAIPAAAMYNYLSSRVARLGSQMESFSHELTNVFQRHLLRRAA